MKKGLLLSFLIYVLFSITTLADNITVSDTVSGTWNTDTVFVVDDIIIPYGSSLQIEAGVKVLFNYNSSMQLYGSIRAMGDENLHIFFSILDTTGFSIDSIPQGGWKGIRFDHNHSSDSSVFSYCDFSYGKAVDADSVKMNGGALSIKHFDKVRIENCEFTTNFAALNGGAIYLNNSNVLLRNCLIQSNSCGTDEEPYGYGGGVCSDSSRCHILKCDFEFNSSTGVGGGAAIRFEDSRLCNNIFKNNYSALGGAIGFLHYHLNWFSQCNNLIYNNEAMFFGGGVSNNDAGPVLVNNTIVYNSSVYGGGFYVKDSIIPNVFNCIIWGNYASSSFGHQVYLWDAYATANFYYSDIQGGKEEFGGSGGGSGYQGIYMDNIENTPVFVDSTARDYHLSAISPCINAGIPDTSGLKIPDFDLDHSSRIFDGRIDMGCYESLYTYVINIPGSNIEVKLYPVPAHDNLYLDFYPVNANITEIQIMNINGKIIYKQKVTANNNLKIDISELESGLYTLLFEIDNVFHSTKFTI